MKRLSLALIVSAVSLVACKEMVTAPGASSDLSARYLVAANPDNPPPPDVDTQSVGSSGGTTFTLNVRYFFNKVGSSGWIKFDSEAGDVSVDKNAQIRYSQGVFSGKGVVTVGTLAIDLSRVSQTSQFSSCESWSAPIGTGDAVTTADTAPVGCFNLVIGGASGSPDIYLTEGCPTSKDVYDPRKVCNPIIRGE